MTVSFASAVNQSVAQSAVVGSHIVDAVLHWCTRLGQVSELDRMLYRPFGSRALERAAKLIESWMHESGMHTRRDTFGSVIGRLRADDDHRPTLLLGSHIDTVPGGGYYDGCLGVLLPIALCAALPERTLPFHIEVIAFLAEEGTRFGTGCLSSRAFVGSLEPSVLEKRDREGESVADAVRVHGGRPEQLTSCAPSTEDILGYLEIHIEQGPELEARGIGLGVVERIVGQSRVALSIEGEASHAGTTPMESRKDALAMAAEMILEVERLARDDASLVATVGRLDITPNASNVVPGLVDMSLDLRHPIDEQRRAALAHMVGFARSRAQTRSLRATWRVDGERNTAECEPALTDELARAVAEVMEQPATRLPSLAGHDAMVMAKIMPVAMLFLRSPGGLSHHEDESVLPADVGLAVDVLARFFDRLVSFPTWRQLADVQDSISW